MQARPICVSRGLRHAALICALVGLVATARSARGDPSGWLGVRAGVGLGDTLVIESGADSFASAPPPSFSLGATGFLSLGLVEIGAGFELSSASGTPAVGTNERLFSQLRAVGLLRWYFVYDAWGGIFMGIGAGLSATRMSDFVRFELVRGTASDLDTVERSPLGLAVEAEFGAAIALSDELRLGIVLGVHTTTDSLMVNGSARSFFTTQAQLHLGVEWAL